MLSPGFHHLEFPWNFIPKQITPSLKYEFLDKYHGVSFIKIS